MVQYFLINNFFQISHCGKMHTWTKGGCCGQLWVRHMFCGQDLWWTIPLHIFHWSCWDILWIPSDHMESLVVKSYSEIEHLHHSIEAQCVIALFPLGDCHRGQVLFTSPDDSLEETVNIKDSVYCIACNAPLLDFTLIPKSETCQIRPNYQEKQIFASPPIWCP